jgi:arylsulfatase A
MADRSSLSRRGFLGALGAAGAAAGLSRLAPGLDALAADPRAGQGKPNVVFCLADDLGYADLSCYGSKHTKTPTLDEIARRGVRFTDFYAACPVCSPTRASVLTGRFHLRAGVYSWISGRHRRMHLRREEVTVAEVLKSAGYDTAHVGKWHLGGTLQGDSTPDGKPTPGDHGFDHWLATANNASPSHRNPKNFYRNGQAVGETKGYSCQLVADEAVRWLDSRTDSGNPFFLNVWFHEPHHKVAAPDDLAARHAETRNPEYYGCIENMDLAIGRLVAHLKKIGQWDNTFFVFMSDNGSYMGGTGSNGPFKAGKTRLWEGGIRVPGIVHYPAGIEGGRELRQPAGVVDLLPTVCELVGAPLPEGRVIDGASLLGLLKAGKDIRRDKPLYWFYSPSRPCCVIREGDWNLVADPTLDLPRANFFQEKWIGLVKDTGLTNFRLYHLRKDPDQTTDLADKEPDRLERMKKTMLALHREIAAEAHDWREE